MKQLVVPAGGGLDYDWTNDHVYVKAPAEMTDGRVTVVEDVLEPGFHLPRHHHRAMAEIFFILDGEATFAFDDEVVVATTRMTIAVPPTVRHEVSAADGARMITIFSPGGFERYLAKLASLSPDQLTDPDVTSRFGHRYDIWVD